jgi:hypothetical protein
LHQKAREVLAHTNSLPAEAACPIRHFEKSASDDLALIKYIEDHVNTENIYDAVYDRHMGHLMRMVLGELLEAFERFIKETAAGCVDFLAPYAADDRFDEFVPIRGAHIGAFVNSGSIGKALCESDTWLNNDTINRRFKSVLKTHFGNDWELLFPGPNQQPQAERQNAATLGILWQIRHTLAHNVGVITESDSMRFRMLINAPVAANERLAPTIADLRYVNRFLFETATRTNTHVCARVGELLTSFHIADASLFDAQLTANLLAGRFGVPVTIHGHTGVI